MAGAILGSVAVTIVPAMLGTFQSYKGFVFAVLLLLTIVVFPGGLASLGMAVLGSARLLMSKLNK
jgi:hypothetical protein